MFNRIRDFLYSLRSEKYKRRVMEKAFASVDEPPEPSIDTKVRAFAAEHWKFLLTFSATVVGIGIALAKYFQ